MTVTTCIRKVLLLAIIGSSCGALLPGGHAQTKSVSPVAPRREQVEAVVKEAYEKFKGDTGGKNADYIPYPHFPPPPSPPPPPQKIKNSRPGYKTQPHCHILPSLTPRYNLTPPPEEPTAQETGRPAEVPPSPRTKIENTQHPHQPQRHPPWADRTRKNLHSASTRPTPNRNPKQK